MEIVHSLVDQAVMKLYGLGKDTLEAAIVAALKEQYQKMVQGALYAS